MDDRVLGGMVHLTEEIMDAAGDILKTPGHVERDGIAFPKNIWFSNDFGNFRMGNS
jgi:hypothetical protein